MEVLSYGIGFQITYPVVTDIFKSFLFDDLLYYFSFNEHDENNWDSNYDFIIDEFNNSDSYSIDFTSRLRLFILSNCKKSSNNINVIFNFIQEYFHQSSSSQFTHANTYAVLKLFLLLFPILIKDNMYHSSIFELLSSIVFPLSTSPCSYIRGYTFIIYRAYLKEYLDKNLIISIAKLVLGALNDEVFVVRYFSSFVIHYLLKYNETIPLFHPHAANILQLLTEFLKVHDSLPFVMSLNSLITSFSDSLSNNILYLVNQTSVNYINHIESLGSCHYDNISNVYDRFMALNKVLLIVLKVYISCPNIMDSFEEIVFNIIIRSLNSNQTEFFNDIFQLYESVVNTRKFISPKLSQLFSTFFALFDTHADLEMIEFAPALVSIITHGSNFLLADNCKHLLFILNFFNTHADSKSIGEGTLFTIMISLESLVLNYIGCIDSLLSGLLSFSITLFNYVFSEDSPDNVKIKIAVIQLLSAFIYHNPTITLNCFAIL